MTGCAVCRAKQVNKLLDFGFQPIANRFLKRQNAQEKRYPLAIGQCGLCGLIQISDPAPVSVLKPKFKWISYLEPERHLDSLAAMLCNLPGITTASNIRGMSTKDESLLGRLKKRGFKNTALLNYKKIPGICKEYPGVEIIGNRFNVTAARAMAKRGGGRAHILIARHVLEHSRNPQRFIKALSALLTNDGYIIFEVPDFSPALKRFVYNTIWEEHVLYFTPATFLRVLKTCGLVDIKFKKFPYLLENSLVAITRIRKSPLGPAGEVFLKNEKSAALKYAREFGRRADMSDDFLRRYRARGSGRMALYGSGHSGCVFVNFFNLEKHFLFVADDNINKQGMFMPGSHLPIRHPSFLIKDKIRLCLLCVNPENERAVIMKNREFVGSGGEFRSIFSLASRRLMNF